MVGGERDTDPAGTVEITGYLSVSQSTSLQNFWNRGILILQRLEVDIMLKFLIKLPVRILFLPILLTLKILFWVCSEILCLSEWIFSLAGTVLLLLGLYSLIFDANMQRLAVILIAFLVSPFGLPMLAMKLVFLLGSAGDMIQEIIY